MVGTVRRPFRSPLAPSRAPPRPAFFPFPVRGGCGNRNRISIDADCRRGAPHPHRQRRFLFGLSPERFSGPTARAGKTRRRRCRAPGLFPCQDFFRRLHRVRCRPDPAHRRRIRGPVSPSSPSPSASRAARAGFSDLRLLRRAGPRSAAVPVADPCRVSAVGCAARRCRLQSGLLLLPVVIVFPSTYAAHASTVPVAGTRAASDFPTDSSWEPEKFQVTASVASRCPVRNFVPYLCPLARPLRAPYRRGHRTVHRIVHRFACRAPSRAASRSPLKRRSGSAASLRRGPESFAVCSSIFSHFYARRRFLSHPTHLWCPQRQMRA